MSAHRLNARLDDDLAAKLAALRRATKQSTTEVVRSALELYHDTVVRRVGSAAAIFDEEGFVGCSDGPADLSERYKAYAAKGVAKKT
jgi:hypothetical protein